jgi:cytochrome c553
MPARVLLLLLLLPGLSMAFNIENAKKINRSCALCHGVYGQGTPGTLSPRLAGLPKEYLVKEMKYYRDGVREYAPMVVSSSITNMSDEDIDDISEYLSGIDLRAMDLPQIPAYTRGKPKEGEELFNDECKTCHKKSGLGKPEKGVPPLAGQYGSYMFSQIRKFKARDRYHDDDPEDETFDDYAENELDHIIAYVTRLPVHPALEGMSGMFTIGMSGMGSMQGMVRAIRNAPAGEQEIPSPDAIAGQFKITPTGEILLNPRNQDLRGVAGLSGDFKITSGGILFIPN